MSNKQKLFDLWANRHGERFHRQSSKSIRKIFHIQKVWGKLQTGVYEPRRPRRCRKYKPVTTIQPICNYVDLSMSEDLKLYEDYIMATKSDIHKILGLNASPSKNIH